MNVGMKWKLFANVATVALVVVIVPTLAASAAK